MLIKLIFSYSTDDAIWQPLAEKLTKLVSVTLIGHKWSETEALMRAIGQRLKRIYLALRGFIPNLEDNLAQPPPASTVPKLEQLLDLCPQLEDLTISFGPLTLNVADEALLGNVQLFFQFSKCGVKKKREILFSKFKVAILAFMIVLKSPLVVIKDQIETYIHYS